jgi:hypothetical protein
LNGPWPAPPCPKAPENIDEGADPADVARYEQLRRQVVEVGLELGDHRQGLQEQAPERVVPVIDGGAQAEQYAAARRSVRIWLTSAFCFTLRVLSRQVAMGSWRRVVTCQEQAASYAAVACVLEAVSTRTNQCVQSYPPSGWSHQQWVPFLSFRMLCSGKS